MFLEYYELNKKHHTLKWIYSQGSVHIEAFYPKGKVNIILSNTY